MLLDFLKGFKVTLKHIFMAQDEVIVQYPEQRRVPLGEASGAPRPLMGWYRGRHKLQRYENGLERCVGCALCAAACPSEAIYLEAAENDPDNPTSAGERYAKVYQIHQLRCIWCGFCEEACPEDAIVMGEDFELAKLSRSQFVAEKKDMLDPVEKGFGAEPEFTVNQPL